MIAAHPWYVVLWAAFNIGLLILLGFRARLKRVNGGDHMAVLDLPDEWRIPRPRSASRIPMHNRFMPEDTSPSRGDNMVHQILADQAMADEKPGKETHALAPGEPGFEAPSQIITVMVDAFTIHMQRGAKTVLVETGRGGDDYPAVEIPTEWSEVVTALAFEVYRLRAEAAEARQWSPR